MHPSLPYVYVIIGDEALINSFEDPHAMTILRWRHAYPYKPIQYSITNSVGHTELLRIILEFL
jgi:hypothetical protein